MRCQILCAALLFPTVARAANGDTNIHVEWVTSTYRISPKPGSKTATTKLDIILHLNGKVEDLFSEVGPHARQFGSKNGKLGEDKTSLTQYRVVDKNTILRTYDDGIFATSTKVELQGQGCKATVSITLNPTLKEYEYYSTELGTKARYRDLKVLKMTCAIK